ncbi:MAG: hypothetical protein MUC50_09355 [Myxococcota bacterium]|nr:hypothetical protein [Myxococcota bacterium]
MKSREFRTISLLFLVSVSVLAYQLSQVRVFAYSLHPVIAYSAIALAMLGFGLGATWLALRPALFEGNVERRISLLLTAMGLSIALVNILFAHTSVFTIPAGTLDARPLWVAVVLIPCALPYLLAGMVTTLLFRSGLAKIGKLYFWNLLGSAVGAIVMILALRPLGAPRIMLGAAALTLLVAPLLWGTVASRAVQLCLAVALLAAMPVADALLPFQPDPNGYHQLFERAELAEGHKRPVNEVTTWDPIGRIDVQRHTRDKLLVSDPIDYRVVTIDGGAMTLMLGDPGTPGWGQEIFGQSMYAAAYQLKKAPDVLVIGAGGGSDIQTALFWNARSVVGVEISEATYEAVTGRYADFVRWPRRDNVSLYHGDGRAYAKSTDKKFDVIQMSGVDTMTMHTSGGAMVAAEDYLYTVDAFVDFLHILNEGGVLSVMRFGDQAMNLSVVAALALRRLGVRSPQDHIVALRQANMSGVLVQRQAFTAAELEAIRQLTVRRTENTVSIPIYDRAKVRLGAVVELLHPETTVPAPRYTAFFEAMAQGKEEEALAEIGNAFVTPTDDRPYYILGSHFEAMNRGEKTHPALFLLIVSTVIIAAFSLVLILLPAVFVRKRTGANTRGLLAVVAYFFSIGAGFMLLEVGLIHRATVFVSTPGAAVAVVLSSILIASGLGALISDRLRVSLRQRVMISFFGLLAMSFLYRFGAEPLFENLFGLPVAVRGMVAALALLPAGFFMGWFFPTGLRLAALLTEDAIPWAIAVNGFASVLGSLATLFIGVTGGLTVVFVVALLLYLFAMISGLLLARGEGRSGASS